MKVLIHMFPYFVHDANFAPNGVFIYKGHDCSFFNQKWPVVLYTCKTSTLIL